MDFIVGFRQFKGWQYSISFLRCMACHQWHLSRIWYLRTLLSGIRIYRIFVHYRYSCCYQWDNARFKRRIGSGLNIQPKITVRMSPNDGLSCTNVDLSCGNGYVGSPSAGWPCLSDSLSSNHGCFGHGRGMSQWGTQYQALNGSSLRILLILL